MGKRKYKYLENYMGHKILIHGVGREWWWEVVISGKSKDSPGSFFSVQAALNGARKYIDRKVV